MNENKWRIGLTEGLLRYFFVLYLPVPTEFEFTRSAERIPYSQGKVSLAGYKSFSMTWDIVPSMTFNFFDRLITEATNDYSSLVFATVDRGTRDWIDVKGYVEPMLYERRTTPRGIRGVGINNLTLTVNNLTVINDPAEF